MFAWLYRAPEGWAAPTALSSLFGGAKAPEVPAPPDPTPMPDIADPAALAAKRRLLESAISQSGRASTMLSGNSDYSGQKLGSR